MAEQFFLGFRLVNLFLPDDPQEIEFETPKGKWLLARDHEFSKNAAAVREDGKIAETYSLEAVGTIDGSRSEALDALFAETIPICLGLSFLTAMSVAPSRGLPFSTIQFISVGNHYPRPRAMGPENPITSDSGEFFEMLEKFVSSYNSIGATEKIRLLVHHWLDALAFWSLEDLVLSTSTILEVIAATSAHKNPSLKTFVPRIDFAAQFSGIPTVPPGFRMMRNDLVHEGLLSGTKFPNKKLEDCAKEVAATLNWIDNYIVKVLNLGGNNKARFSARDLEGASSFSI